MNTHSYLKTQHVLTSLIECTLLTKTALSSVLEFSVHSKSKKKKKVNMIKIHILELASYALSSMKTPRNKGQTGRKLKL